MVEYQIWIVFAVLISGLVLFILQRIRYDIVAVLMLLAIGLTGILSFEELFSGFASPAVVTVASALIIARSLEKSGILSKVEEYLLRFENRPILPFILLLIIVCLASGFINDIAALAITLPIALSLSRSLKIEPSKILIPLAYGSIIGGSLTLIGTASNIVMGTIAARELGRPLAIFEFFPVGLTLIVAFIMIFFIMGKRVLPVRATQHGDKFELPKYIAEVLVTEKCKFLDKTIGELELEYTSEIEVVRIVKEHHERELPHSNTKIGLGDVLVVTSEAGVLEKLIKGSGLELLKGRRNEETKDLHVIEAIVLPYSMLVGKSARQVSLRDRFNVALLGIARHGSTLVRRVDDIPIRIGDALLLEVAQADLQTALQELQCAPLYKRGISLHPRASATLTLSIGGVSIALSAFGILPVEIALPIGVVAMLISKSISLKEAYEAVQWPILILIGSIIPFGIAMENTGADRLIAEQISNAGLSDPIVALAVIFIATTLLSNVINNVAAAVFMAPVALQLSDILGVSGFPMLMGVIFGAAVPYLTPISHHSNLLVMEAGGYRFTDYLRLGIPMTIVTMIIVLSLVPVLWPF